MASSQVEIASSSPFGCVLRDNNNSHSHSHSHRKEQWRRESKARAAARAAFHKNPLKDLFLKEEEEEEEDHHHHFHSNENSQINPQIQNSNFLVWQQQQQQQQQQTNNNNKNKIDCWAKAREMVSSSSLSHSLDDVSGGGGGGGGGVSSLVQRWRDLAEDSIKLNQPNSARSNPPGSSNSYQNENACEFVDERFDTPSIMSTDDSSSSSFADWESDRTSPTATAPPPPPSSARDARESERIRVADIIKKLKLSVANDSAREQSFENESLPRVRTLSDQTDQNRGFSPRIRGRQAFNDLLMQMERDRHRELEGLVERHAVSRFQQRGRIQSLLRLRFLRREATVGGNEHSNSAASGSNRLARGSTITLLRERFNTGVEHDETNLKSPCGEVVNNTLNVEISSTSNQLLRENIQHQEATNPTDRNSSSPVQNSVSYRTENLHEEASSSSGSVWQRTSHDVEKNLEETSPSDENRNNLDLQQPEHKVTSSSARDENVNSEEQEGNSTQLVRSDCEWESEISGGRGRWGEQEVDHDWLSVLSQPQSDWEMQDANEQQLVENNIDWISDISRPRSDWEGLRQARYQEMLDPYSENEDLRKLLERRSVSTFLSSNLRETMDQLMISRAQNSIERPPNQIDDSQQEEEEGLRERMAQFMMSSGNERQTEAMDSQQEENQQTVEEQEEEPEDDYEEEDEDEKEEDDEEEENEEEESCLIGDEYNEHRDYFDQTTPSRQQPLPSLTRPWRHNGDQEISDDSDPALSPSLRQPSSSHSSFHPSIEMELIYDLRGHMEQLHQEIFELRRTINSCMSMQVKLQRSVKQEVEAVHPAGGKRKKSVNRRREAPTSKGSCCVCYEKQVDSLLYRCGHMCTCFKCAHELQWSSGKCPICRAPIVDIVRAYTDSEYR